MELITGEEEAPDAEQQIKDAVSTQAFRVALGMLHDEDVAEEVADTVLTKYLGLFGPHHPPRTSLDDVAHRFALDAAIDKVRSIAKRAARRFKVDKDTAHDLANTVVVKYLRKHESRPPDVSLDQHIKAVTRNVFRDELRHQRVHRRAVPNLMMQTRRSPSPIANAILREQWALLGRAMARLTPIEQTIVVRHEIDAMDIDSIADGLSLPSATIRLKLGRALIKLRHALHEPDAGPAPTIEVRIGHVEAALDNIDPKEREVLLRWILEDMKKSEVVEREGVTKVFLEDARAHLVRQLARRRLASQPTPRLNVLRSLAEQDPEAADVFVAVSFEGLRTNDLVPSRGTQREVNELRTTARKWIAPRARLAREAKAAAAGVALTEERS
jgi:RNA polymerase sigma factor (sigma-70 family)